MKKRIFTPEEIDKVIYNYTVLGMGQKRAGAEFHMDDRMVKRLLIENGVHIKSIQETNISKYGMNHNYFSTQGHNQAYIIGFLGADGNISAKDNRIDLTATSEFDYNIAISIINEEEYDSNLLNEGVAFNEVYKQNNRKNCVLLPYKGILKALEENEIR